MNKLLTWAREWWFYLVLYLLGWVVMGVLHLNGVVDPWWVVIFALGFLQNFVFTLVSRSRNRDRLDLHFPIAVFSNVIWFLCFREVVMHIQDWYILAWYGVATSCGSVVSMKFSMYVEKFFNSLSDAK